VWTSTATAVSVASSLTVSAAAGPLLRSLAGELGRLHQHLVGNEGLLQCSLMLYAGASHLHALCVSLNPELAALPGQGITRPDLGHQVGLVALHVSWPFAVVHCAPFCRRVTSPHSHLQVGTSAFFAAALDALECHQSRQYLSDLPTSLGCEGLLVGAAKLLGLAAQQDFGPALHLCLCQRLQVAAEVQLMLASEQLHLPPGEQHPLLDPSALGELRSLMALILAPFDAPLSAGALPSSESPKFQGQPLMCMCPAHVLHMYCTGTACVLHVHVYYINTACVLHVQAYFPSSKSPRAPPFSRTP
jgi:hypothetical protein